MHYGKLQYLVKWVEYSMSNNKWILARNLRAADEYVTEFHQKYPLKPSPEICIEKSNAVVKKAKTSLIKGADARYQLRPGCALRCAYFGDYFQNFLFLLCF